VHCLFSLESAGKLLFLEKEENIVLTGFLKEVKET